MPRTRPILAAAIALTAGPWAAAGLGGCEAPRGPASVDSEDTDLKVQAIKRDVALRDDRHAPELVRDLDDPDPAVRFYAVQALRRLSGDAYGYHFYDDEDARKPAVARWRAWLASHGDAGATPGAAEAGGH